MEAPAAPQEGLLNQWRSDIEAGGVVVSSRWDGSKPYDITIAIWLGEKTSFSQLLKVDSESCKLKIQFQKNCNLRCSSFWEEVAAVYDKSDNFCNLWWMSNLLPPDSQYNSITRLIHL